MELRPGLSLSEWAVLAVLVEAPRHGYDIAAELEPTAEIGRVWRLNRQLVYRALARLQAQGLVEPARHEPGHAGPPRTVYGPTARGRRELTAWLDSPVGHLREVRSGLLLKLVIGRRLGHDPARLVEAQLAAFGHHFAALTEPPDPADVVDLWRHHTARAAQEFLLALRRDQPNVASRSAASASTSRRLQKVKRMR